MLVRDLAQAEQILGRPLALNPIFGDKPGKPANVLQRESRPLVLVEPTGELGRSYLELTAPHGRFLGIQLPASPVQALLMSHMDGPVICTSSNLHGDPIALSRGDLGDMFNAPGIMVADAPLKIIHPMEDSVVAVTNDKPVPLRRARGFVPKPISLPWTLKSPTLALGGDLMNVMAFGAGNTVWLSPHFGDQQSPDARKRALKWIHQLPALPQRVAFDPHPAYFLGQLLASFHGSEHVPIPHHRAHAAQVLARFHGDLGPYGLFAYPKKLLVLTWDGAGWGEDESIWGGEAFLGNREALPTAYKRVASVEPLPLPGGNKAAKEPGRIIHALRKKEFAGPMVRSMGRLFDCAAYLLGLGEENTFEGDLPHRLEAAAARFEGKTYRLLKHVCEEKKGLAVFPSIKALAALENRRQQGESVESLAFSFHQTIAAYARALQKRWSWPMVLCAGGVFANQLLSAELDHLVNPFRDNLHGLSYNAYLPNLLLDALPPGDGGLAYGQLAYVASLDQA